MEKFEPEKNARKVVDECADRDICRFLMDADCLFFPELYRLYDKEVETGEEITSTELRKLVDLCNFCALCPCPPVRANIIEAKTRFIDRDGLKFGVRTLKDVERVAKLFGAFPRLTNMLLRGKATGDLIKKAAGIHPARQIPTFPGESFPQWAKKRASIPGLKRTRTAKSLILQAALPIIFFLKCREPLLTFFSTTGSKSFIRNKNVAACRLF
jgi:glycerol-3-phosphate dehydrogenase subunit C